MDIPSSFELETSVEKPASTFVISGKSLVLLVLRILSIQRDSTWQIFYCKTDNYPERTKMARNVTNIDQWEHHWSNRTDTTEQSRLVLPQKEMIACVTITLHQKSKTAIPRYTVHYIKRFPMST